MQYNKTPQDIENETGRKFTDICNELLDQGLSPTEIAIKLELKNSQYIRGKLRLEKLRNRENILYPEIRFKTLDAIERLFPKLSGMEFRDFLYQKYIIEGMSMLELENMLGLAISTIGKHIKHYGFKKTPQQAREDAIKKGHIDYQMIHSKRRKTKNKSKSMSNKQELAHVLIKSKFEEYLIQNKLDNIEIIVGLNEWGILKDKEIDIPIIITDFLMNQFKKYAIEYNGEYWHDQEKLIIDDQVKQEDLKKHGWTQYIIIDYQSNVKIEQQINEVVDKIITDFLNK